MESIIFIETERLYLRQWLASDAAAYIEMNADEEVMRYFPSTRTAAETAEHIISIQEQIASQGYGLFAVEKKDDHSFIGFTGFSHPKFEAAFTPCIEIGWRLAKYCWNKGYATEAAKACVEFGFTKLALKEIYSFTSIHNLPSEQVMKKIGMHQVGFFDHPLVEAHHYLQKHVLYQITPAGK